ncbi:MAG: ABC transporter transmembrane domain-containing protein [Rhodopseudomonas palustris]|nr:ABC transporter transmembrane domain-containing protein [Rhodopseudomonas palustris]
MVPLAVRRLIDLGFGHEGLEMINSYFAIMVLIVAVLAIASAARYYLVMTIGERIVADLRRDVLTHLTSLSPSFFDPARSGAIARRGSPPTPPRSSRRSAPRSRIALRNMMLFIGASTMMVISSPRLSAFVLAAIPLIVLPLVAFGRRELAAVAQRQDTLADASAYAAELVSSIRTVQAKHQSRASPSSASRARSRAPAKRRAAPPAPARC